MKTLKRRRLEAKTDYGARLTLLKSAKPRLVIRKTNKYMIAQIVSSEIAQDKVVVGLTSKSLLSKGWSPESKGSLKSIPASYLTGLLLGKMAKGKADEMILDIGMHRNVKKSRVYAVVRGILDSGIKMAVSEEVLPDMKSYKVNDKIKPVYEKALKEIQK